MKKIFYYFISITSFLIIFYLCIGFYLANSILKIDYSCGLHQGSLPNTWLTTNDHAEYTILAQNNLRKNFPSHKYHLKK